MLSIVTINYNNAKGLLETLRSIEKQICFDRFEHIIIDGGSKDSSVNHIINYVDKKTNVKWLSEKDAGIYNAMNKGIDMSSGEYIAFLNSGDKFSKNNSLNKVVSMLSNDPSVDFIYCNIDIIDNNGNIKRKWLSGNFSMLKLYFGWIPPHPLTTIRKSLIEKYSGFNEVYKIASDYDLMLRIILNEKLNLEYINDVLVKMEDGGVSNSSISSVLKGNFDILKCWYKLRGLLTPFWIVITKLYFKLSQFKKI